MLNHIVENSYNSVSLLIFYLKKIEKYKQKQIKLKETFKKTANNKVEIKLKKIEDKLKLYINLSEQLKANNNIDLNDSSINLSQIKIEVCFKRYLISAVLEKIETNKISYKTLSKLLTYGIHPVSINSLISNFIEDSELSIRKESKYPNVIQFNTFINSAYDALKNSYSDSLSIVGITRII